jgi:hypothetical protein
MKTGVPDWTPSAAIVDEAGEGKETYWTSPYWTRNLGYYLEVAPLKQSIDALAMWAIGKGFTTDTVNETRLGKVHGWGEDSFDSILMNMLIVKKINGDAFAEIIRKDNDNPKSPLINLKPLNPMRMRIVVNSKGLITRYDEMDSKRKNAKRSFKPEQIFHITESRVANQIHGTSIIDSVKWAVDSWNEAMNDWRRISHRSTIRVMYIDADDTARLNQIKSEYKDAVKNGELMIIPAKKGEAEFQDISLPPSQPFLEWIRYLEGYFQKAVGVPDVILGGSAQYTEASAKIGYLTFEQPYMTEQRLLEQDIWNQLHIELEFIRPIGLKDDIQQSEAANTGQVGIQPTETEATVTRNE